MPEITKDMINEAIRQCDAIGLNAATVYTRSTRDSGYTLKVVKEDGLWWVCENMTFGA